MSSYRSRQRKSSSTSNNVTEQPPRDDPTLFNAQGNPFIGGYKCCGRSFFGYWMGWIAIFGFILIVLYLGQMANDFSKRHQRAGDRLDKISERWLRLILTNFSSLPENKAKQRVGDFLVQNFGNGPFEFVTNEGDGASTKDKEPFLKHSQGKGYSVDYDEDDLALDADGLLSVIGSWSSRIESMRKVRLSKTLRQDTDTEQVDKRGSYIRATSSVSIIWDVPIFANGRQRHYWSFEFSGILREPKDGTEEWKLYNAEAYEWFEKDGVK